jgi:hypothetical protein
MKSKPIRTTYRVDMRMIGSGVLINYYQGDYAMSMAIAESLRRGKTGGRVTELPTNRLLAEWDEDSLEIRMVP